MRKIIYLIAAVLTAMLFVSCVYEKGRRMDSEVIYANAEDSSVCNYKVRLLFEVDDVKVYSFENNGYTVYFTNCTGNTLYNHTRRTGKSAKTRRVECMCNQNN
ncbi:MAG: hypothetical protein ACI4SO_04175, partial [Muribaculaceae bacterium]